MRSLHIVVLTFVLGLPSWVQAQPTEAIALADDVPLTIRPAAGARPLAVRVARILGLRLDVPVAVGEEAPGHLQEAIAAGSVGILLEEDTAHLVLAAPQGRVLRSVLALEGTAGQRARAVALAIEVLRETATQPPPSEGESTTYQVDGQEVTWTYLEPEGGLFGPLPDTEARAKPIVYLGLLGGLSTERLTALVGPRLGAGLCLDDSCIVIEGDLSVIPEATDACDGRVIEYRATTLSLRLQARPVVFGDVSFAVDLGILMRFGLANLVGVDTSRLTTNFGLRGGLEMGWHFTEALEIAWEIGVDIHTSPAVLTRRNRPPPGILCPPIESVLVEDLATVFGVVALRLRP